MGVTDSLGELTMRTRSFSFVTLIVAALVLAGCGGMQQKQTPLTFNPVAMSITDTPPAGVNSLSFEINVTGASLQPSDSSKAAVNLLTHPVEVELEQLETENAILNTASVPPDTYKSLTLTFASPELTILNQT